MLHAAAPEASRTAEIAVLTVTNLAVTVLRFVLMRVWVFARR